MSKILLVLSSPRGKDSHSSNVATVLAERLAAATPKATIHLRDLAAEPLAHIDTDFLVATRAPEETLNETQRAKLAATNMLIDEVLSADAIVIASSMINFAPTSTLKSWLDHLALAGRTFRYSEAGVPEGLVTGKKVYLVQAKGGIYDNDTMRAMDFQQPYLQHMLGFMGMTDVEIITAQGIAYGPEFAEKAVSGALAHVSSLVLGAQASHAA